MCDLLDHVGPHGRNIFHYACLVGNRQWVESLLELERKHNVYVINMQQDSGKKHDHSVIDILSIVDDNGQTGLHLATINTRVDVVVYLCGLEQKRNNFRYIPDKWGLSAMFYACQPGTPGTILYDLTYCGRDNSFTTLEGSFGRRMSKQLGNCMQGMMEQREKMQNMLWNHGVNKDVGDIIMSYH